MILVMLVLATSVQYCLSHSRMIAGISTTACRRAMILIGTVSVFRISRMVLVLAGLESGTRVDNHEESFA